MTKKKDSPKEEDIEVAPDAWERFERAIDKVTRTASKPLPQRRKDKRSTPKNGG